MNRSSFIFFFSLSLRSFHMFSSLTIMGNFKYPSKFDFFYIFYSNDKFMNLALSLTIENFLKSNILLMNFNKIGTQNKKNKIGYHVLHTMKSTTVAQFLWFIHFFRSCQKFATDSVLFLCWWICAHLHVYIHHDHTTNHTNSANLSSRCLCVCG